MVTGPAVIVIVQNIDTLTVRTTFGIACVALTFAGLTEMPRGFIALFAALTAIVNIVVEIYACSIAKLKSVTLT